MEEDYSDLLLETKTVMSAINKEPQDVLWVGSQDGQYAISWEEFVDLAKGQRYDPGFGAQVVAFDLVIVFKDNSWLSRAEYDGSEWWAYNKTPILRSDARKFKRLMSSDDPWSSIKSLNEPDDLDLPQDSYWE